MTKLMAEDRPLWTGRVDLHGVNPEVWAGTGEMSFRTQPHDSLSKTQINMAQEERVPFPLGGLAGHHPII